MDYREWHVANHHPWNWGYEFDSHVNAYLCHILGFDIDWGFADD